MKIPKFILTKNEQFDVLIYLKSNSFLISTYVLRGIPHLSISPPRGDPHENSIYLSWNILRRTWKNLPLAWAKLPKLKWKDRMILAVGNLIRVYTLSVIESYRPKVVLCLIDNSFDFQWISQRGRDIEFAAIAQGPRDEINLTEEVPKLPPHPAAIYAVPHYFGWGQRDRSVLERFGALINEFHAIGPLRAGYYVSTRPQIKPPVFHICLVSQYVEEIMEHDRHPEVKKSLVLLHQYLRQYVEEQGLHLVVAARSANPKEIDYFFHIFGREVTIQSYSLEHFSTYSAIDASQLVVTHDSSAAREAYCWGKKVLFTNYSGNKRRSFFSPGPWLLEQSGYDQFKERANLLMSMSSNEFDEIACASRSELAIIDPAMPAHVKLRLWVLQKISSTALPS